MEQKTYWPFMVPRPEERTDLAEQRIHFLETAYRKGFKSYRAAAGLLGASANSGRIGEIVHRGRDRYWEVFLETETNEYLRMYIDGFKNAAEVVLRWLGGEPISDIRSHLQAYVVPKPGHNGWDATK